MTTSGSSSDTPPPAEPDFEAMDAAELRAVVKELWKTSRLARHQVPHGSISAPGASPILSP